METARYSEIRESSKDLGDILLADQNASASGDAASRPLRASTFPASPGTTYKTSAPLFQRPAPNPAQPPSDDNKTVSESERRRSSLSIWQQRLKGYVSPSFHNVNETDPFSASIPSTVRPYLHKRQRWRLWRLSIGEWFITLVLCIAYFTLLYGWSRRRTMNPEQKRIFNTLSTGLSLLLGLNLAGSLRSYAKLLRWRILAACYRPLGTFDLVLGCSSQMNVLRLLFKARNSRHRYLPSRTQLFCVLWLFVNLATAILVAIIGLTYNLDTSTSFVLTTTGEITVLDFTALQSNNYLKDLSDLQAWGVTGTSWQVVNSTAYADAFQGIYETDYVGNSRYWFIDINADSGADDISFRYVDSNVECYSYDVVEGQYGNLSYVVYESDGQQYNQTILDLPNPGGLAFVTDTNSTCGDRCTNIIAFQALPLPDDDFTSITTAKVFSCGSTIYAVQDYTGATIPPYGVISNDIARMYAGAIGWSGVQVPDDKAEYLSYSEASPVGFLADPSTKGMADLISEFSIGAFAAMDDPNVGALRRTVSGTQPSQADYLHVKWWRAGPLLIVIPCIHFVTLMLVIGWANQAIIKDDSHLAAAKVYRSLIGEMGEHGCMLQGEEMVEELGDPMVVYGWAGGDSVKDLKHVDVFQEKTKVDPNRKFEQGPYDGGCDVKKEKRRVLDARNYF